MLPIEKSKDLIEHIKSLLRRTGHLKEVKSQLFEFITEVQELYSSFSQKIHKEMIAFEEKIVKNSLYSTEKTNYIINFAKIYRQFSIQLEKNSKINLINLQRIKADELSKHEDKLQRKCDFFLKQFGQYLQAEKNYNNKYNIYSNKCNELDQIIRKYRSYQDPIVFYNQIITSEYIYELDKQYNDCTNFETTVVNDTQGLDQTRKWICENIKEINDCYVALLHFYLEIIESVINCVVDPRKESSIEKNKIGLRNSELSLDNQHFQLEKLNNLYSSELNNQRNLDDRDNIIEEYSQLFKGNFTQGELNSDYKFFYDRCDSIRNKKLKTTEEIFRIQSLLIGQLTKQSENYSNFEKEYRVIERDIFTNNGIDSFKKRFRKYFGTNFMEIQELCFTIIDRQKKSLEKIGKSTEDSQQKLKRLIQSKQESIKLFEKRSKMILDEHLKLKEKTYSHGSVDSEQLKFFKESIAQSFNQLKKSFLQLQKNQSEVDILFFGNLKNHYETILKQAINKNLSRVLQKQKNRLNILTSLNVTTQVVLILKEDSRYETLMTECPKPILYTSFQSLAKKKEYDETKKLLQMKENRLKNMIRSKKGCCGVTSQPIKNNVLSEHKCKLITDKKLKGILNIASTGLIFEEQSWNPFCDGLRLMIPQSDIIAFDTKKSGEKDAIEIVTEFGNLTFESKVCTQIIQSMQKNITFKPMRQGSERGGKKNDSSSFMKNSSSTEYKLTFEKSAKNGLSSDGKYPPNKNDKNPKNKGVDSAAKDLIRKWKENNFLNSHFTRIIKDLPEKNENRRDYKYSSAHSRFELKERRSYEMEGKNIVLIYEWKICFPDSPMLRSFKHGQKVYIEDINKDLRIRVITAKSNEQQLFVRNIFNKELEDMNAKLTKFIVDTLEKEANIIIEAENDNDRTSQNCSIVYDDINIEQREGKGENTLRASRLQRQRSSGTLTGFKTM